MKHSNIKLTTEQFIERAKQKHGDKYDYSKVAYVKYNIKVLISIARIGSNNGGKEDGIDIKLQASRRGLPWHVGLVLSSSTFLLKPISRNNSYFWQWKCHKVGKGQKSVTYYLNVPLIQNDKG